VTVLRFRRVGDGYTVNGRPLEAMTDDERETFAAALEAIVGPLIEGRRDVDSLLAFVAESDHALERTTLGEIIDLDRRRTPGRPGRQEQHEKRLAVIERLIFDLGPRATAQRVAERMGAAKDGARPPYAWRLTVRRAGGWVALRERVLRG
jgi:hypothetical protein